MVSLYTNDTEEPVFRPRRQAVLNPLDTTTNQVATTTSAPPMSTGYPAVPVSTPTMSTGYPAVPAETPVTAPPMSTGYPAVPANPTQGIAVGEPNPSAPTGTNWQTLLAQLQQRLGTTQPVITRGIPEFSPDGIVQNTMAAMLDPSSPYIQRARQAALDDAANRGLLNSSIAAGNAQGAAIDRALPLVQESLGITNRRETQAFQQQQAVQNAQLQDWLENNNFTRNFTASLALMPINNAFDLSKMVYQQAMSDPETYTPEAISGMSNFFNRDMLAILQQYFPNMFGSGG